MKSTLKIYSVEELQEFSFAPDKCLVFGCPVTVYFLRVEIIIYSIIYIAFTLLPFFFFFIKNHPNSYKKGILRKSLLAYLY